ncbi:helix-turn-helix domain-containing protein [Streptomyces uncialis]|uniref:helix-turn-helix domain-containing protein n=1 Tax=Streptomyces uncialis TaxID=1048205 RepID=UPI003816BC22
MHRGPAVRRRKLGGELRRLRLAAALTSGQAARRAGWNQSKVSRIETARSAVKSDDVRLLLDIYEVADPALRDLLVALADLGPAAVDRWWHAYRGLLPPTYRDFISLEAQACRMRTLENSVVPGLLQTPEYARAVTRASVEGLSDTEIAELVEVRLTRQDVLRRDPPPRFEAVVDEAVLRRPVGGAAVMDGQLDHLVRSARPDGVDLRVLPFAAGEHIGLTGPFVMFSFPGNSDLDVVVVDNLTSSLYLEGKEDVKAYLDAFSSLQRHALSPEDSLDFIAGVRHGA